MAARTMLSEVSYGAEQTLIEEYSRLAEPVLLGLAVLAVRGRVKR